MFKPYRRKGIVEMRPYREGEDLAGITVSSVDIPPKRGDMIARNPSNNQDMWLVSQEYFEKHYQLA